MSGSFILKDDLFDMIVRELHKVFLVSQAALLSPFLLYLGSTPISLELGKLFYFLKDLCFSNVATRRLGGRPYIFTFALSLLENSFRGAV